MRINIIMRVLTYILLILLVSGGYLSSVSPAGTEQAEQESLFLLAINAPDNLKPAQKSKPVVIAIVDDGVRMTHRDLADFIWTNPGEIPGNLIDDDGNGYVDDVHGWDVSDGDDSAAPPEGRSEFYHGTHVGGIVAQIAKRAYGGSAPEYIKIIPVKSLSDNAENTYLREAYRGIEYAIDAGADIILCSWSKGVITPEEARILELAENKGVLIVASAGNFPEEREQFPAAYPPVLAVSAVYDQDRIIKDSNFGQFVDLSAPGSGILSAGVESDEAYETHDGTSFSAPMVAAAAALIMLQHPAYSVKEIDACLKSSSGTIEGPAPRYAGKLGAGMLNVKSAVRCGLFNEHDHDVKHRLVQPKGYLHYAGAAESPVSWSIEPEGEFKGVWIRPQLNREETSPGTIEIYAGKSSDQRKVAGYSLESLPEKIFVPGSSAFVRLAPVDPGQKFDILLAYEAETIDFSKIYCDGISYRNKGGTLTDGSGPDDYFYNTSCKWLITAPEGKVIHFEFNEFDTEARTDWVYFFNGAGTHEKIMAMFSGPDIPPELTTWGNQVLVWFVTNEVNQHHGWQLEYDFRDPEVRTSDIRNLPE